MADQLYKFITYADDPNGNPLGIPGECACQLLPLPEGDDGSTVAAPWQVVTLTQYNAYVASKQPLYDDWAATIDNARNAATTLIYQTRDALVAPIDAKRDDLLALVGNAQTVTAINAVDLTGWPTVTVP